MPTTYENYGFQKKRVSILLYAQIAQSVEQGTENPRVGGSIPPLGTIKKRLEYSNRFFLCTIDLSFIL